MKRKISIDMMSELDLLFTDRNDWSCIGEIINKLEIFNELSLIFAKQQKVVLFGVGVYGQLALQFFKKHGIEILYFCDNDRKKHGKFYNGVQVISPDQLKDIPNCLVLITARHCVREISCQLSKLPLWHASFDAYVVNTMLDKFQFVYAHLINEQRSRQVYVSILKSMLLGNNAYCRSVMEDNAFFAIPEFSGMGNEVFVDAGAYVGDTLEQFIWKTIGSFKKAYAFEPGEKQYNAMQHRINRLKQEWSLTQDQVIAVRAGLGGTDALLSYFYNDASPSDSHFDTKNREGQKQAQVYSLDSYFADEAVTMIKADIEGFEMDMLKGGENLIKRCRPKLAISVYHRADDLFEIPMYIHSLAPEYKMALRHHSPRLLETVLYCWT